MGHSDLCGGKHAVWIGGGTRGSSRPHQPGAGGPTAASPLQVALEEPLRAAHVKQRGREPGAGPGWCVVPAGPRGSIGVKGEQRGISQL